MRSGEIGTLRMRFAWRAAAVTVLVVGLLGIASVIFWQERVRAAVEDGVAVHLSAVESELDLAAVDLSEVSSPVVLPTPERFVQVVTPSGRVVASSSELASAGPVVDPDVVGALQVPYVAEIPNPGDPADTALIMARTLDIDGSVLVGIVGASLAPVSDARSLALWILIIATPLLAAAIGYGVWLAVTYALRPVTDLANEADALAKASGPWTLKTNPDTVEMRALAESLDGLLEHIRASFEGERRFLDDASHELRTPIAVARGELDLLRVGVGDDPDVATALASAIEELDRLDRLAADLLVLARARGSHPDVLQHCDLAGVARRVSAAVMREPYQRDVDVRVQGAASTVGDEAALERVFLNLIDNAVTHCTARVDVSLSESDGEASAVISDDGPGFAPNLMGDSFARFASDRDRSAGGAGLGLAIASAIVRAHGGHLTVENAKSGGGVVTVRLPSWTADSPPAQVASRVPPQPMDDPAVR